MKRQAWVCAVVLSVGCGNKPASEHEEGDEHEAHERHGGEEHEEGRAEEVVLTAEAVAASGILVEAATKQRMLHGVRVPAEVVLDAERVAHVRSPVEGPIVEVHVSLGDRVHAGDALAQIRSVAAGEARASLTEARSRVEVARAAVARQEELVRAGVGAQRNLIDAQGELRTAQAELRSAGERTRLYGGGSGSAGTMIRAPLDGEVLERHATVGEMVHNDDSLFLIGDLTRVWITAHVYEQDVAVARPDLPARLTLDAYAGRTWDGRLTYVASRLDPETRTLEIRIELPNDGTLRPGLFGTLWLPPAGTDPSEAVLAVPEGAVQRVEGAAAVFVEVAPNRYALRPVELGARGAGVVEIRGGLTEGARIVVAGSFVLKSELMKGQVGGHEH